MSIAADLAAMVTGFGSVPVVSGDVEGRGLLDEQDGYVTDGAGAEVLQRRVVLTLRRSDWPDLAPNDAVTIEGVDYRIGDLQLAADGLVLQATVKRVSRAARG